MAHEVIEIYLTVLWFYRHLDFNISVFQPCPYYAMYIGLRFVPPLQGSPINDNG